MNSIKKFSEYLSKNIVIDEAKIPDKTIEVLEDFADYILNDIVN
jgi:hypothetical protein